MSQIRENVWGALAGLRGDFKSLTKAMFWFTLGSLGTLLAAAPEATLTKQVLPLEVGLLIGMALGVLSYRDG
ncbi:MAG: hypothetical protein ABIJ47_06975 [Candidatus Bathyarchaeota archaeon]